MIEKPEVGQRVFRLWSDGTGVWATVRGVLVGTVGSTRVLIEYDWGGLLEMPVHDGSRLYATASEAAAALRAEAQRLIEAADRLEQ